MEETVQMEPFSWVVSVCVSCCELLTVSLNKSQVSYKWEYALAQMVEATSRKVAGSIPVEVIGIFHFT